MPTFGTGADHPEWKGELAGYVACHGRVYRRRGKAVSCVFGCTAGPFEWANLTGNYPDANDYAAMCRSCHTKFDDAARSMAADFAGRKRRHSALTEALVKAARRRRAAGEKLKDLAEEYGISCPALSEAINGRTWQWVK